MQAIPVSESPNPIDGVGNFTVYVRSQMQEGKKVLVGLDAAAQGIYDSPAPNHAWPYTLDYGSNATGEVTLPVSVTRKLGQQTPNSVTIYVYKYDVSSATPGNQTIQATTVPQDAGS